MNGITGFAGTWSFPLEMEIFPPLGGVQVVQAMVCLEKSAD
jgi:hypothetical protein